MKLVTRQGHARIDTSRHCCDGRCQHGDCPLIVRRVVAPVRMPAPRIQMTGGPISRWRLAGRFMRDLWEHLCSPRWMS